MARHLAWILAAALVHGIPTAAAALCAPGEAEGQDEPRGPASRGRGDESRKPQGRSEHHRPWKFWQGESKTELGLTNQQSSEIEQIFRSTLPRLEAAKDQIDKLEATLSQTIKDNTAEIAIVAQQVDRLEAARADLSKTRTLMLYRMRGVLSAEQRTKLQTLWEAGRPKGQAPSERR